MNFSEYKNVKIITGEGAVKKNYSVFSSLGKKALVVSGRNGADKCGAMADVAAALDMAGVDYVRFGCIPENPPAELCHEGGKTARENGCDFIIAIGGGSSLDAGKAIAGYAANPDCAPDDIFDDEKRTNDCLPIAAIPTTSGTGSEACRYSVLTIDGGRKKKTFKHKSAYAKYAFVCPEYSSTMPALYTVSTALDALAHSIESYLSPKSTPESEEAALYAAHEIWDVIFSGSGVSEDEYSREARERLAYAACAAGIAIDYTGTGFPHPLGYSITLTRGIPHGNACAVFEGAYLTYNMLTDEGSAKIEKLAAHLGTTPEDMIKRIPEKSGVAEKVGKIPEDEREELIDRVAGAANYQNSPYVISRGEMSDIYTRIFG